MDNPAEAFDPLNAEQYLPDEQDDQDLHQQQQDVQHHHHQQLQPQPQEAQLNDHPDNMAVAIPGSDAQSKALADFSQDAETEFRVAEGLLSNSTLDLEATRSIVLNLRTLALEHRGRGCDDLQMEKWILQRTRCITKALVDGVKLVR